MNWRARVVLGLVAVWLLASAGLAAVGWPRYWAYVASEQTPMTWLQSVVLVLAGAGSALLGFVLIRAGGGRRDVRPWVVLALGFGALAFDERFAVHERVRDGVLAPRGIAVPFLPWVAPGDFLVLAVALIGLALLPMVWRAVRQDTWSRQALSVGVALALLAVAADSIDPSGFSLGVERLEQSAEEVVELGSGLAFLGAVLLRLLGELERHVKPSRPGVSASAIMDA